MHKFFRRARVARELKSCLADEKRFLCATGFRGLGIRGLGIRGLGI